MARTIDATCDEAAWSWVASAAGKDENRPILLNVEVSRAGRVLVATDGASLHVAVLDEPCGLPDGIFDAVTRWPAEGLFPQSWRQITLDGYERPARDYNVTEDGALRAIADGLGRAFKKTKGLYGYLSVDGTDGSVLLNPQRMSAALEAIEPTYDCLYVAGQENPVLITDSRWKRIAVVMPVRAELIVPAYDISPLLTPVSGPRAELPKPLRDSAPLTVVPDREPGRA